MAKIDKQKSKKKVYKKKSKEHNVIVELKKAELLNQLAMFANELDKSGHIKVSYYVSEVLKTIKNKQ